MGHGRDLLRRQDGRGGGHHRGAAQLDEWNPQDGGTFEQIVAHLTVDANGVRGDEPGFDKNNVEVHGPGATAPEEAVGDNPTVRLTGSTGWQATDENPWGTHFELDNQEFQDTIDWYFGLVDKGYMPSYAEIGGSATGPDKQLQSGSAVLGLAGSWMISTYADHADGNDIDIRIAPTPIGPSGQRASMFNGLADSITR